jgi:hypothetical protein
VYAFAHGRANPQTVERQEQAKLPAVTTGYLASKQNCRSHKKQKWSGRFNGLVEVTNARVILSSTHRLYEETRCGLLAAGILFEGCTPDLPTQTRAAEITAWWQKHILGLNSVFQPLQTL